MGSSNMKVIYFDHLRLFLFPLSKHRRLRADPAGVSPQLRLSSKVGRHLCIIIRHWDLRGGSEGRNVAV